MEKFFKLATHNGIFHGDDVISTSMMKTVYPDAKVIRVNAQMLKNLDVSNTLVYDIGNGEFDHHCLRKKIADDGHEMASLGLLWERFSQNLKLSKKTKIAIYENIIRPVDIQDNGGKRNLLSEYINISKPDWDVSTPDEMDSIFETLYTRFKFIFESELTGEIQDITDEIPEICLNKFPEADSSPLAYIKAIDEKAYEKLMLLMVEAIEKEEAAEKRAEAIIAEALKNRVVPEMVVLDKYVPVNLFEGVEGLAIVVAPGMRNDYDVQIVRNNELMSRLPWKWCGYTGNGPAPFPGMTFCHSAGFIAAAETKEAAIKIAEEAIRLDKEAKANGLKA